MPELFWRSAEFFGTSTEFGLSSTNFADRLLSKAEVAVVPGIAFGDDKTVRLSYATDLETIKTGLDRIEQFCRTI